MKRRGSHQDNHWPERRPLRAMREHPRITLIAVLGCLVLLGTLLVVLPSGPGRRHAPPGRCAASAQLVPPCGVWWGAYVPSEADGLKAAVTHLERKIGRRLDVVYTYHDMSTGDDGQLITQDERALGADRLLMVAWSTTIWQPATSSGGRTVLKWRDIADGKYDRNVIDPQIQRVRDYGKPVLFTFDQEPESRVGPAGSPADFVAAWRHLYQRFHALGAGNAIWVWTVTGYVAEGNAALMRRLYPGDAFVQWLAYDPYNYFACKSISTWQSFAQVARPGYDWLRAHVSARKPMMIAEYSTARDPAHPDAQRAWYEGVPAALRSMPGIRAALQWDSSIPGPDCDLTLGDPAALSGFAAAGRDPLFHQPVPVG